MNRFRKTWLRTLLLVAMMAGWGVNALEAGLPDPCGEQIDRPSISAIDGSGSSESRSGSQDGHDRHACHCTHTHFSGVLTAEATAASATPQSHPTILAAQSYRSRTLTPPVPPPLS